MTGPATVAIRRAAARLPSFRNRLTGPTGRVVGTTVTAPGSVHAGVPARASRGGWAM